LATGNKDFKVKNGLIVEGTTATVNGNNVLTEISSIGDLFDVDTSSAKEGDSLVFDTTSSSWIPAEISAGDIGYTYTASTTAPAEPSPGDIWFNTNDGDVFIYYEDEDSSQWVEIVNKPVGEKGDTGRFSISSTRPSEPEVGDGWLDLDTGFLYVYIDDGDSFQWIQV
jgi:hypothetical protein